MMDLSQYDPNAFDRRNAEEQMKAEELFRALGPAMADMFKPSRVQYDPANERIQANVQRVVNEGKTPGLEEMFPQLDLAMLLAAPGVGQAGKKVAGKGVEAVKDMGEKGFINWPSGHAYDNAFLHRSLSAEELPFLERILGRGGSTQAPTTPVGPNMLTVFQNSPRGLMLNVEDPKTIKWAAPEDMWSEMRRVLPPKAQQARDRISKWFEAGSDLDRGNYRAERYRDAYNAIGEKYDDVPRVWTPTARTNIWGVDDYTKETLADLLKTPRLAFPEDSPALRHSEIIPEINRDMLAGVRLPMPATQTDPITGRAPDLLNRAIKRGNKPFLEFADKFKLPVYRWPVDWKAGQQAKMLENPFAGNWVNAGDYITSSEVEKLLQALQGAQ